MFVINYDNFINKEHFSKLDIKSFDKKWKI